jgi:succinate-semialdehyde dehydrogenase/glutarate-semialdehyde dehydrogenase
VPETMSDIAIRDLVDVRLLPDAALLDGQWIQADNGDRFDIDNPATGSVIARVPALGVSESRRAVDAAHAAQPAWARLTANERARVLRRWADLIVAHKDHLARILTCEQGKPLAEATGEVGAAAAFFEWYGEEAKRVYGETVPSPDPAKRIVVLKEPIGVCVAITPWNFPAAMVARKVAPALAAGCTVVLKPAEQTPLTALAMSVLGVEAGLPRGVLNVLTVDSRSVGAVGLELTTSPKVGKLTFTGSTAVGKQLMAQCASTVKALSLELGGNAPFIVFDDADVDAAVQGAISAKFRNAGQICVAANRFLVAAQVYDEFSAKLASAAESMVPGPGWEPGSQVGPLIDNAAVAKVREHVEDALQRGATIVAGGETTDAAGRFFKPTVLANVSPDSLMSRDETFGPIAGLTRFTTEAQAITMANDTEYGLAAYFYTAGLARTWRIAEALKFGVVGINTGMVATEVAPFGGFKESGIGREGSRHGIEEFLEVKYLSVGGIE